MTKVLFFICIGLFFVFDTNFCMFLYTLQKKQSLFNKFFYKKPLKKQLSPTQWFYLQRLFLKRNQLLDTLRKNLKVKDMDWLKFHNEFINMQIYNELTVLQTPRKEVMHEEKMSELILIARNIGEELGIDINAINIFLSVDKLLSETEKEELKITKKFLWGLALYPDDPRVCYHCRIPSMGINKNLIEKSKWHEDIENKSIEWFLIAHEITHLVCSHIPLKNMVEVLMQEYQYFTQDIKKVKFLKEELDKHLEKEANEIPLIVSEKIFKEIWKYTPSYIDDNCFVWQKIPSLSWPNNLTEIKREVWDKKD